MTNSSARPGTNQVIVTNVTRNVAPIVPKNSTSTTHPNGAAKGGSTAVKRAGSANDKVENPTHTNKMLYAFTRLGMPNFYKLDKQTYLRSDIADIGQKVAKKLEECDALIDYERRKNQITTREKVELQQKINGLIEQATQDE